MTFDLEDEKKEEKEILKGTGAFTLSADGKMMLVIRGQSGTIQKAAKDPRFLVECASRLARCFVDKGYPKLAIKWLEKGLESPTLVEEAAEGLRAQLAEVRASTGERNPSKAAGARAPAPEEVEVQARRSELETS